MPKKPKKPKEEPMEEPLEEDSVPFICCGDCDTHNPIGSFSCKHCPNVL
jgi:hypothetical protein